jgi:endonuclease/exonuclease/phosphatase family metal-dependent hydrolase
LKNFIKYILLIFNVIIASLLLLSYASLRIPPDKFWIFAIAGLLYPWLLGLNIVICIAWFLVKSKYALISLLVILLGWNVMNRYVQLSGKTTEEKEFRVLSYNVGNFRGPDGNPSRSLADQIKGFLKETRPDIICLQEVRLRTNSVFNLAATLKELPWIRHYQYARISSTNGSVTMTRFPIVKMNEIRFENSGNIAISTDIADGSDTFRIFNVHLQSYWIDPDKYSIIESPGLSTEKELREARELGSKYRKAVILRAEQARLIHEKIMESPYPVIVCGDFNDTPSSYTYQKVRGPLKDAFVQSGRGIGNTYIGKLPSFRIDYILHSKAFESYNFQTRNVAFSDHYPVYCDMVWNRY